MQHALNTMEEVQGSEKYRFYRDLGYTEKQSVVLTLLDFDSPSGGYPEIVNAYGKRKKKDERSFPEFFCDYVFDRDRLRRDGFAPEPEAAERRGFLGLPLRGRSRNALNRPAPEAGMILEDACAPTVGMAAPRESAAIPVMGRPNPAPEAEEVFLPDPEDLRTDSYELIEERGMRSVSVSPTATFRTTYNTAAASVVLSNIRNGSRISPSMVRTEELLNYLRYDLARPEDRMFAVTAELKEAGGRSMLFLGIQGKRVSPARQNICFLLDVSGSMSSRAGNMLMSIMAVLSKMSDGDVFSLVTYSSTDKVVFNGLTLDKARDLDDMLYILMREVYISGMTNGSAGIGKAYDIVEQHMVPDGVNRVIILTDGDLNFGVSDKDGLKALIEKKRSSGAYFSAIGTGIFNLQDDKLEALAKNGNGNYFVVNSRSDIEKNILGSYESLVYPIARNVKAQVEFNPKLVDKYKLIGYENRMLGHEDFRDDAVIAEPFGSGSACVALFALEMCSGSRPSPAGLKYQQAVLADSDELATLTLRYEDAKTGETQELSFPISAELPATENIARAADCAFLADKLRSGDPDSLTLTRLERLLEA
jgi:Ca-activated chloride channel family protein